MGATGHARIPLPSRKGEFEEVIMIEVRIEEMVGSN
jgi:hypothetical protein